MTIILTIILITGLMTTLLAARPAYQPISVPVRRPGEKDRSHGKRPFPNILSFSPPSSHLGENKTYFRR